jgi:hypothetical protein
MASHEGVDEGLTPKAVIKQATEMTVNDAGVLIVKTQGNTRGIMYAPGLWVHAQLEVEAL